MDLTQTWKEKIERGDLDERLLELYVDEARIPAQRKRYGAAVAKFEQLFGTGDVEIYSAPGRSEVGGNHTDHQHGEVLAASVNLDAIAVVAGRQDGKIQLLSEGYPMLSVDLRELSAKKEEEGTSLALIRGMAYGLQKNGHNIGGFSAYVTSDVLGGAGLSSSASFEVLIGTILSGLYNGGTVDPVEIAQVAQFAENVYFGKPCGLMDQMACSVGGLIHIDFLDVAHPVVEKVPVDFTAYGHSLCITDTKGSHADLTDEYAAIPAEMCAVAEALGKKVLREADETSFLQQIPVLRQKLGDRAVLRAMHFYAENARAEQQVKALAQGDFARFLALVEESGNSSFEFLQNVYAAKEVKSQAVSIGLAVSRKALEGGHGVCRVHGGGFAGTIQAFVANEYVDAYKKALDGVFGTGACQVLKVRPVGGVCVFS